jgi:hypothetical protein
MFQKAERKKARLRLALCGPAGSGKTYSALLIAQGLGGKIALIDTEHESGSLYADLCEFDTASLTPPYTPEKYRNAIAAAEAAGYSVLIIDSFSHAWAGEGGLLDMHDKAAAAMRSGNSFTAWREITPQHNALVEAVLGARLHVIATLRTKTAYDLVDDGNGKKKPVKIGLAPVQREGVDYEFTCVFDMSIDSHVATASKDRTRLFDGKHFTPGIETGQVLMNWLETGIDGDAKAAAARDVLAARISAIENLFEFRNWWKKHQAEIDALPIIDRTIIVNLKDRKKAELEKGEVKDGALV